MPVLEGLRGFAALSVCLYHFVCTTTGYITNQTVLSVFHVGQDGVRLFFVISGFVIPWSLYHGGYRTANFFRFLLKRIARLEPPYLVSVAFALGMLFLRTRFYRDAVPQAPVTVKQVALHIGYLIPFARGYQWLNGVYWTLAIEFQFYIVVALLYTRIAAAKPGGRVLLYVGSIALSFATPSAFLPYWLPLFVMGATVFLFRAGKISRAEAGAALTVLAAFAIYRDGPSATAYAILPVLAILATPNWRAPGLANLGRLSYSVYLIHSLIGGTFINLLSHRYTAPGETLLVILAGLGITLAAAEIMHRLVEQPSKRLSKAIAYRGSGADFQRDDGTTRQVVELQPSA